MKLDMNFEESNQSFEMNVSGAVVVNGGGGGGNDGKDGGYYIPKVSQTSVDSFSLEFTKSDAEMPPVPAQKVNLYVPKDGEKGEPGRDGAKGDKGDRGERGEKGDPGEQGAPGSPGRDGSDGEDGFSPSVSIEDIPEGHRVTITDRSGSLVFDVLNGANGKDGKDGTDGQPGKDGTDGVNGKDGQPGQDGADGYTPQKGVDYFTQEEVAQIVQTVLASVPVIGWNNPSKGAVWFNSNENKVSGQFSTASGTKNTIISVAALAAGANNTVGGIVGDKIFGNYSGAIGDMNTVVGNYSTGMGYGTINPGHYAHTFNRETSTFDGSYYQSAFGFCNEAKADSLFMVGMGASNSSRLNVFEIDKHGTVTIKNSASGVEPTLMLGNSKMTASSLSMMDALTSWGGQAVYLKSPNGSKYKITVSDAGTLAATKV